MTRAVLWDLDGTLVDSEDYHWRAWRDTMAREGIALTEQQFLATFGLRNDEILPRWLGEAATADRIQRIGREKEVLYRKLLREGGAACLPGVAEWLHRLRREGWRQAVASSAPRQNVEVVLEVLHLAGCFDAQVTAEDVTIGKPDPQVFLSAAARLDAAPARCVVVEDSPLGIQAARRAGMHSIGASRKGRLTAADIAVSTLAGLPQDAFARLVECRPGEYR